MVSFPQCQHPWTYQVLVHDGYLPGNCFYFFPLHILKPFPKFTRSWALFCSLLNHQSPVRNLGHSEYLIRTCCVHQSMHPLLHQFIHSFSHHIPTGHSLWTRSWTSSWSYNDESELVLSLTKLIT